MSKDYNYNIQKKYVDKEYEAINQLSKEIEKRLEIISKLNKDFKKHGIELLPDGDNILNDPWLLTRRGLLPRYIQVSLSEAKNILQKLDKLGY